MSLARVQRLSLGCARLQIQRDIQRIEREVVPMRLARRRTGSTITDPFEVVQTLQSFVGQTILRRNAFREPPQVKRELVDHPMYPCAYRCIGIVRNEDEAFR